MFAHYRDTSLSERLPVQPGRASILAGLLVAGLSLPGLASAQSESKQRSKERGLQHFRHVAPDLQEPDLKGLGQIRFLTDDNFPPFSYRNARGALAGFNIVLADAVCKDLRLKCRFVAKPWDGVVAALLAGEGDAILSGIRRTEQHYKVLDFTRPYFRTLARFAVRVENPIGKPDVRALAGKRIGVLAGSRHEQFLKAHYRRSNLRAFDNDTQAREALRTGGVDALFGDGTKLMFWIAGSSSRGCCRFASGAFADRRYFDSGMAIAVKRGNKKLRKALDYGLDRLQMTGRYSAIFRLYFPKDPW